MEIFIDSNFVFNSRLNLNECRKMNIFTDFTLKATNGEVVQVHKIVLIATCPYFAALFNTNLVEIHTQTIHFKNIFTKEELDIIVEYLYTGKAAMRKNMAERIFECSNFLQLNNLQNFCAKILTHDINDDSWLKWFRFSTLYTDNTLMKGCIKFIAMNINSLLNKYLKQITLDELKIIISDDLLECQPERSFTLIVNWVNLDLKNRTVHMENLLKHINLMDIAEDYLEQAVENNDMLRQSKIFSYTLLEMVARAYRRKKSSSDEDEDNNLTVVVNREVASVPIMHARSMISHVMDTNERDVMPIYPIGRSPPTLEPDFPMQSARIPTGRERPTRPIIFENLDNQPAPKRNLPIPQGQSRYLRRLSTATRSYRDLPSTSRGLSPQPDNLKNIFISHHFSIEKLNLDENTWETRNMFPADKYQYSVASDRKFIFMIGGLSTRSETTNVVNCYNDETNSFSRIPSMLTPRKSHKSIFFKDQIYACGGEETRGSVECYDLEREIWSRAPQMNKSHTYFGLATNGDCMYAVAGALEKSIERYDPRQGKWVIIGRVPRNSFICKSLCNNNSLYCIEPSSSGLIYDLRTMKLREEIFPEIEIEETVNSWHRYDVVELNGEVFAVFHNQLYQYDEFVWKNLDASYLRYNVESINLCTLN